MNIYPKVKMNVKVIMSYANQVNPNVFEIQRANKSWIWSKPFLHSTNAATHLSSWVNIGRRIWTVDILNVLDCTAVAACTMVDFCDWETGESINIGSSQLPLELLQDLGSSWVSWDFRGKRAGTEPI